MVVSDVKKTQLQKLNPLVFEQHDVRRVPISLASKGAPGPAEIQSTPSPMIRPAEVLARPQSIYSEGGVARVELATVLGGVGKAKLPFMVAGAAVKTLAKVPAIGKFLGRPDLVTRGGQTVQKATMVGGTLAAGALFDAAAGKAWRAVRGAGADPGQIQGMTGGELKTMTRNGGLMKVGGMLPFGNQIVKVWDTAPGAGVTGGGAFPTFALLVDGRIAAVKLDGSIKTYRPYKPLVIGKRPSIYTLARAERKINRIAKIFKKHLRKHS